MIFKPVDETREIADARITVTDGLTGAVIEPETDGTYILCDGIYYYSVEADGYESVTGAMLELSPATESKEIIVKMTA